jgi:hypothetical protein
MSHERQPCGPEPVLTGASLHRRANWHLIGQANRHIQGGERTDWRLKLDPENAGREAGWG